MEIEDDMSEYVRVELSGINIFIVEHLKAIPDSDCDIKVAKYICANIKAKADGMGIKDIRILSDITKYERMNCTKIAGISYPSMEARQIYSQSLREDVVSRFVLYKKGVEKIHESIAKNIQTYGIYEMRVFGDRQKALEWLAESI